MITRISSVLEYVIHKIDSRASFLSVADAVTEVILRHYCHLEACGRHLLSGRHYCAATVCDYLMDAHFYFEWFVLFSPENSMLTTHDLHHITHVSKQLQRKYRIQVLFIALLHNDCILLCLLRVKRKVHRKQWPPL